MNLMEIDGAALPAPLAGGYTVTRSDLDGNTTRSETGIMFRDRVRAGVYKIESEWEMSMTQLAEMVELISPASFNLKFFDITTCQFVTRKMYVSDRTATVIDYIDENNTNIATCSLACSFVEF